jgi:hypothetical protein
MGTSVCLIVRENEYLLQSDADDGHAKMSKEEEALLRLTLDG